jgi:hypothetical protein
VLDEAGLADAGLALHDDEAASACTRRRPALDQLAHLLAPTDEDVRACHGFARCQQFADPPARPSWHHLHVPSRGTDASPRSGRRQRGPTTSASVTEASTPPGVGLITRRSLERRLKVHAVEDFADEVGDAEGGDPLPAHEVTKIIGEVLAALDS